MSKETRTRPWLWPITFIGVIVPARLRADWRQEWVAELRYREDLLAEWDRLNWRAKLNLIWSSASALWDALWMQTHRWEDALVQDIRYGVRLMRKGPSFTALAVLAIALGIGVNTAAFSVVHATILLPLPVDKPSELVAPHWGSKNDERVWGSFSYPNYLDLRDQNQTFSDLCAWRKTSAGISFGETGDNQTTVIWGELVTSNYFEVMGVKPILGRGFRLDENVTPNAHPLVVISHEVWKDHFNADADVLGKTVFLNGQEFSVIGVAPESFIGGEIYQRHAFWIPAMMGQTFGRAADWNTNRKSEQFKLYGRLKPGVTMAQAEIDLNGVVASLAERYPSENSGAKIQLTTEADARYESYTPIIQYAGVLVLFVSALVLLLACANVANLLLARAASRAREIGTRLAIGATSGRMVRQLLTESLLLALMGGALGWAFAYWGTILLQSSVPPGPYPHRFDITPDSYVLMWTLLVSSITGVIFGLAPALYASRADLVAVIKGATWRSRKARRWNLRSALVVGQVTISIIVLICAGLFIRTLGKVLETDPGFNSDNMVTMMINPRLLGYDQNTVSQFFPELLRRIEAQPGVRVAALADDLVLQASDLSRGPIVKEGEADPPPNLGVIAKCSYVSPKYFETVRTPLLLGREFTERDDAVAPPVVIVNQEFARKFYGTPENAIGKRFRLGEGKRMEVVGVAKDGFYRTLYEDRRPYMFLPLYQQSHAAVTLIVSAKTPDDLQGVVAAARREIAQMDPRLPVVGLKVAEENMANAYWAPRLSAGMASTFGVLALVLATMGLYSVMTYSVAQRTREIGIRMAIGATLRDVLRLIFGDGMRLVIIGLVLGLVCAFAFTRVLSNLLLGVGATDPLTFAAVAILLLATAMLACLIPARQATKLDPMVALRQE